MLSRDDVMVKGPSSIVRPIKEKIRDLAFGRRIRIEEFFKVGRVVGEGREGGGGFLFSHHGRLPPQQTFDKRRSKKISRAQFLRGLDDAGLKLNEKEAMALAIRYAVPGDEFLINYRKFCDQIDKGARAALIGYWSV